MNPIIVAVDAGHFHRIHRHYAREEPGLYCRADDASWPCPTMLAARKANLDYAAARRQDNEIAAGKLSVPAR